MKIAVAGGIGIEDALLKGLAGHRILLVGNAFNIKSEKFPHFKEAECIGEYVTRNYQSIFSDYDLFIDISESMKSKYLFNDFAVKFKKKYIALFFDEAWKIGVFCPGKGCLACYREYKRPGPFYLNSPVDGEKAVNAVLSHCNEDENGSFIRGLDDGRVLNVPEAPECRASRGDLRFLAGEMEDVVSISCGDNTVSVTPMNEVAIDLNYYREILSKELKVIKQSPFFLEFKLFQLNILLFKQGRIIVKGTKDKRTAMAVYRRYIGT